MKQITIRDYLQLHRNDHQLAACIGYFDGLHRGHQILINEAKKIAQEFNYETALITFDPDPWTVIHNKSHVKHLTPIKEKVRIAESLGIDYLITIEFTKDLSKLSPLEFIEKILVPLNVKTLICGADYKFGYRGEGSVDDLEELGHYYFDTHVVPLDHVNEQKIGTTAITQAILNGDVQQANDLLGRLYSISGFVVGGQHRGREIGFPTANMDVVDEYVIPKQGVYAGFVEVKGIMYQSVINIGHNPTFNTTEHLSLETYILDFDEDIYGEVIKQSFVKRLRDELKFDSIETLVEQMHRDVKEARLILDETNG
ncbi:bifunctional riboflavin kinase/FAD synthetase [Erysipelothrix rhusiopathiae]|uniref:bifunctional riboflavin kinase/FAD synthetase n=1 Tax=Erysipelothrix rhusiopathiae TaxID=1648 RepID=UPI002B240D47|nr:bifunctional riboflavin kinase/FAD synthetase [Erysipelothrix rhusiopathiae]WRB92364.1 bifunctional riboflavin kinase/FAD synthetase [Erysipelothrix rhusiopathiae]